MLSSCLHQNLGDQVVIQASRLAGGNAVIDLRGPDGARIGNVALGGTTAVKEAALTQSGLHTIIITERDQNDTLGYVLNIQCVIGSCF